MSALATPSRALDADTDIVRWPYGWYVVGRADDLPKRAVRSVAIAGRDYVFYRAESGALHALDGHCPHMGAHLRHGAVVGEQLRCALHGWLIDENGRVRGAGSGCPKAGKWPIAERFGLIFVHFGHGEPSAVPAPDDADKYVWTTGKPIPIDADWRCMATNAFDMPHLCTVHHRDLVEPIDTGVSNGRVWLRYVSRVTGGSLSDRFMKWVARDRIRVRMSCFGTVILAETDLGFTRTAAILGMLPDQSGLRAFGAFGIQPGRCLRVRLWLTRLLFTAFLRRDFKVVEGMVLRMDDRDPGLRALFDHLRRLRGVRS